MLDFTRFCYFPPCLRPSRLFDKKAYLSVAVCPFAPLSTIICLLLLHQSYSTACIYLVLLDFTHLSLAKWAEQIDIIDNYGLAALAGEIKTRRMAKWARVNNKGKKTQRTG